MTPAGEGTDSSRDPCDSRDGMSECSRAAPRLHAEWDGSLDPRAATLTHFTGLPVSRVNSQMSDCVTRREKYASLRSRESCAGPITSRCTEKTFCVFPDRVSSTWKSLPSDHDSRVFRRIAVALR